MSTEEIVAYAQQIGIDVIGFTHNITTSNYQQRLKAQYDQDKLYRRQGTLSNYDNPDYFLPNTKTIISIGISFQQPYPSFKGCYGYISKASFGLDYHQQLHRLGEQLIAYLKTNYPALKGRVLCDTSLLDDRHYAYLAGNGFYGKNSMLINETYGSMVFYATILLDEALNFKQPKLIPTQCGSCALCECACPTHSLNNGELSYQTCLSHLTQSREMIDLDKLHYRLYGCDTCNNVCPFNRQVKANKFFHETAGFYDLIDLIKTSKRDYQALFANQSLLWLNHNIIKKNAILNLYYYWDEYQDAIIKLYYELRARPHSRLLVQAFEYLFDQLEVNIDEV